MRSDHIQYRVWRSLLLGVITGVLFHVSEAQPPTPTPAPPQDTPIVLVGGTIHTATGEVIEEGAISFREGVIQWVGKAEEQLPVQEGPEPVRKDISGQHIYPGLIAPNTILGLTEIDAVRATHDYREQGRFNPSVRSIIAYNADSRIIPTIRSNGILMAQVVPKSGWISGTSSCVELDAWSWEGAAYETDMGLHVHWPDLFQSKGWWARPGPTERNKKWEQQVEQIKTYVKEARAYCQQARPETRNVEFEAMRGLFNGSQTLFLHANFAREIISGINFFRKQGIQDIVLVGGADSWRLTDYLKEREIKVMINQTHTLPERKFEGLNRPFELPAILDTAGIQYCLSRGGSWDVRNLMFHAGTAAAHGLSKEEALQSITINTARILGVADSIGTLEKGKHATCIVSEGDILDMRHSEVTQAYIQGRQISLKNKQKSLYRKFQKKYQRSE